MQRVADQVCRNRRELVVVAVTARPVIYERDVDTLLERKLTSDQQFLTTFIREVERQTNHRFHWRTCTVTKQSPHKGTHGTIDLLVRLFDEGRETGLILIENKLDSSFTPNQPERYRSSAIAMTRPGCKAVGIICAPGDYIHKSKYVDPFHARVGYEFLREHVEEDDCSILDSALLRYSMPYEPDPVPEVRQFHEGYVRLIQNLAPELVVKSNPNTGGERPKDSRTMYFDVRKTLPRYDFIPTMRFSHQCWDSSAPSASVKIMFAGWARHCAALRQNNDLQESPFYLRPAGGSLGLAHDTPRLDNTKSVAQQMTAVVEGIRAAAALRAWMFANEQTLRRWAASLG